MDEKDHELAARVHYSFLPDYYSDEFIDIAVQAQPVSKIGGDYCSILPLNENRLVVGMCDVTGHNIASALFAARINTFVVTQAVRYQSPCRLISLLNEFLCKRLAGSLILTSFCSIIFDFAKGTMDFASAAHPPVIHFQRHNMTTDLLSSETTLLGFQHPLLVACRTEKIQLQPGDRIVLYTDGLTEIRNEAGDFFGVKGLQTFTANHSELESDAFNRQLLATALNYGNGNATDDILLMTMTIK